MKNVRIMRLDDGVLGFSAAREDFSLRLWAREAGEGWVLRKTVQLDKLLPLSAVPLPETDIQSPFDNISPVKILGASEYDSVIFLWTMFGNFMLNLGSMKLKKLCDHTKRLDTVYPYESFYAPGKYSLFFLQTYLFLDVLLDTFLKYEKKNIPECISINLNSIEV